jgi:hypothetical protein
MYALEALDLAGKGLNAFSVLFKKKIKQKVADFLENTIGVQSRT